MRRPRQAAPACATDTDVEEQGATRLPSGFLRSGTQEASCSDDAPVCLAATTVDLCGDTTAGATALDVESWVLHEGPAASAVTTGQADMKPEPGASLELAELHIRVIRGSNAASGRYKKQCC